MHDHQPVVTFLNCELEVPSVMLCDAMCAPPKLDSGLHSAMAAIVESNAVFRNRAKAMGISEDVIAAAVGFGWGTLATFAFSAAYTPGMGSDEVFVRDVIVPLLGNAQDPRRSQTAALRRLFFEAYSLVTAELRSRVEKGPESETPRKLPNPERIVRRARIVGQLNGLELEGPLEPSHSLVDLVVSMVEDSVVRYISWSDCNTREQELANSKKDKNWRPGTDGVIREQIVDAKVIADLSSDLRLMQALQRRGIALDVGGAMTYKVHDTWVRLMIREHQRVPPHGFSALSYEQLERADREVFRRMAEDCRDGIQVTAMGVFPMDAALPGILLEATVRMLLQPLALAGTALRQVHKLPPAPPPQVLALAVAADTDSAGHPPKTPKKKVKKDRVKVPAYLKGSTKDADGQPICFAFNTKGTGCSDSACTRKHVCMSCFGQHPLYKHKKSKP